MNVYLILNKTKTKVMVKKFIPKTVKVEGETLEVVDNSSLRQQIQRKQSMRVK